MTMRNQNLSSRGGSAQQFPGKFHDLMSYVEREGLESIISWVKDGTAVMIHNPLKLVDILRVFFCQTIKYRSFRRQLSGWHFERLEEGPLKGAFVHPYFRRGEIELCSLMRRSKPPSPPTISFAHSLSDEKNQCQSEPSPEADSTLKASQVKSSSYNTAEGEPSSLRSDADFLSTAISAAEAVIDPSNEYRGGLDEEGIPCEYINDGDPVSFAGRRFHFVDFTTSRNLPSDRIDGLKNTTEKCARLNGVATDIQRRKMALFDILRDSSGLNVC